jgi:hypothetical protein
MSDPIIKRYSIVAYGIEEKPKGSLLRVEDVIQHLRYILHDDELVISRCESLLDILRNPK